MCNKRDKATKTVREREREGEGGIEANTFWMHFSSSRVVRNTTKRDFIVVLNIDSTAQTSEIVSFVLYLLDFIMSSKNILKDQRILKTSSQRKK